MPRQARVDVPGELYHVIARGNERKKIFRDEDDFHTYTESLLKTARRDAARLYAYCLMPNHVHLLLEPTGRPLGRFMQSLHTRYAQHVNRKYRRVGHLFQGRFRSILCDKDSYLVELVRYIHLNPVRAGLVSSPARYPYSSHRLYLDGKESAGLERDFVLGLLGGPRKYQAFMREGRGTLHREELYGEEGTLGSESFTQRIQEQARHPLSLPVWKVRPALRDIQRRVVELTGLDGGVLKRRDRTVKGREARGLFVALCREVGRHSVLETARWLGRDPARVIRMQRDFDAEPGARALFGKATALWRKV